VRFTNLTSAVLWQASQGGERPCVRFVRDGVVQTRTWHQLADELTGLLVGLDRLSLHRGTRVALLSHNRWEWILVDLAAAGRGVATVALDPGWSDNLLARIVDHAAAESVIVETIEDACRIQRLRRRLPTVRSVVVIESDVAPEATCLLGDLVEAGRATREEGRVAGLLEAVNPDDVAGVIFTGGSTGIPRGVIRTHGNALSRGWLWFPWMGDEPERAPAPDDVLLDPLSFCHSAGRWGFQMALARGVTLALPGSATLSLEDLRLLSPTHMIAVPRVVAALQKLLLARFREPGSPSDRAARLRVETGGLLKSIVSGGAALPTPLIEFFEQAGIEMRVAYGSTEAGIVSMCPAAAGGGVGRPTGVELRIDQGEILVRGPSVTPGYLDNAPATHLARTEDGWWRTGDTGRLDDQGRLSIGGRIRAQFNCHEGTNIDPSAVEQLLEADRHILEAVVVGHGRPYIVALVVPDHDMLVLDGVNEPEAFLNARVAMLNERLESFEKVRRICLVDQEMMAKVRSVTVAQKIRIDRDAVDRVFAAEVGLLYDDGAPRPG
jgi:long-chain acyl-CoA synthetase